MSDPGLLEQSERYCRDVTRQSGTNFALPFKTLPRRKRSAFEVVYAFMRLCDDLSDEDSTADPAARFSDWRKALDRALKGDASGHPVLPALVKVVEDFSIPHELLENLIDGVAMDLDINRYGTFEELYGYCYKVASVVGLVSLRIFGLKDPSPEAWRSAEHQAEACGIAFQLTNILRDIKEDLGRDRIYIPLEDLKRYDLEENHLRSEPLDLRFLALMRFQVQRVEKFYETSGELVSMLSPDARPCLSAMREVYHGLLQQIVGNNYDIWSQRATLPVTRKLGIAARAFLGRFTS